MLHGECTSCISRAQGLNTSSIREIGHHVLAGGSGTGGPGGYKGAQVETSDAIQCTRARHMGSRVEHTAGRIDASRTDAALGSLARGLDQNEVEVRLFTGRGAFFSIGRAPIDIVHPRRLCELYVDVNVFVTGLCITRVRFVLQQQSQERGELHQAIATQM